MRISRKPLVSVAAIGASALLLSGCMVSGGGWFGGTNAKNSKVTTGFSFACDEEGITGEMSFIDRRSPARSFVAVPNSCGASVIDGNVEEAFLFGTYRPRPHGAGGTFVAGLTDTGMTGPSKGDTLRIRLVGGAYDGYTFDEVLDGGNITFTDLW
jgi:hypothetical protein